MLNVGIFSINSLNIPIIRYIIRFEHQYASRVPDPLLFDYEFIDVQKNVFIITSQVENQKIRNIE